MDTQATVLIVEDDDDLVRIFQNIMEMYGMDVEIVKDGALAMARLETHTFDLILLDMQLPKVSGEVILRHIRTAPHLADTKVAVMTGNHMLTLDIEGTFDFVLFKPFTLNQLGKIAEQIRENKKSE